MRHRTAGLITLLALVAGAPSLAQEYPRHGTPKETLGGPRPAVAFVFKLGELQPTGDSDLWAFHEDLFTADVDDFNDLAFGFDFLLLAQPHLEFAFGMEAYEGSAGSVYRDYVDSFGQPIAQEQELNLVPLTVSVRWLPCGRYGGANGAPRPVVPYLGIGMGMLIWEYELAGSFVDLGTLEIYDDYFYDDGATLAAVATAGIELRVSRAWSVHLEGRYLWAEDDLGIDFVGFDDLDLSSWAFFGGVSVR
jgi:outer membrane protein W